MRLEYLALLSGFAVAACVLPSVEVDKDFSPGGSGGRAGSPANAGAANNAGRGGIGGIGSLGGRGGSPGSAGDEVDGRSREEACLNYCQVYFSACRDFETNTYDDERDCDNTCLSADWPFGTDRNQGNSVQCRETHAQLAVDQGSVPHCFHSAEFPSMGSCER